MTALREVKASLSLCTHTQTHTQRQLLPYPSFTTEILYPWPITQIVFLSLFSLAKRDATFGCEHLCRHTPLVFSTHSFGAGQISKTIRQASVYKPFFFFSPPSYLCLRFSATVNNIFRDNETHRARQRKKGRGEAGKDTHHYLNLTALKVGLGFQTHFDRQ